MMPEFPAGWAGLHLALHFIIPVIVALVFYRRRWRVTALILVATMVVDIDHLLAEPVYDPARCSIGFHPLHTAFPLVIYGILALLPLIAGQVGIHNRRGVWTLHLIGVGLLIHMALDWSDCIRMMA
jgi:hypothetical protein